MGNTEQERNAIATAYPSDKWREKVKKMSPAQVAAVYIRLKNEGKLGK